jgi:hypothetical protein
MGNKPSNPSSAPETPLLWDLDDAKEIHHLCLCAEMYGVSRFFETFPNMQFNKDGVKFQYVTHNYCLFERNQLICDTQEGQITFTVGYYPVLRLCSTSLPSHEVLRILRILKGIL